ncbi:MAG: hypothetical protein SVY10_20730 [Thermodesulfobacteriota bacterium]|nr:hypothetical protein [Thermodesulfobacteriota bacterium]
MLKRGYWAGHVRFLLVQLKLILSTAQEIVTDSLVMNSDLDLTLLAKDT